MEQLSVQVLTQTLYASEQVNRHPMFSNATLHSLEKTAFHSYSSNVWDSVSLFIPLPWDPCFPSFYFSMLKDWLFSCSIPISKSKPMGFTSFILNFVALFTQLVPFLSTDFALEGYLSKTGPGEQDAYRRRWFILDHRKLMYHTGQMVGDGHSLLF